MRPPADDSATAIVSLRSFSRLPSEDASTARSFIIASLAWKIAAFQGVSSRDVTDARSRSEEHTSELQSLAYLVCRLLLEKKKKTDAHQLHAYTWLQCGDP